MAVPVAAGRPRPVGVGMGRGPAYTILGVVGVTIPEAVRGAKWPLAQWIADVRAESFVQTNNNAVHPLARTAGRTRRDPWGSCALL